MGQDFQVHESGEHGHSEDFRQDQERAGFEWKDQLDRERNQLTAEALERCLKAGAHPEDLEYLAREFGIEWKPTNQRKEGGLNGKDR